MAFFKYIIDLLIVISLSSCSNLEKNIPTEEEELLSFDVSTLDNKEYEIKLSDLMESVEIVQLDNSTDEAYTGIFKLGISDTLPCHIDSPKHSGQTIQQKRRSLYQKHWN